MSNQPYYGYNQPNNEFQNRGAPQPMYTEVKYDYGQDDKRDQMNFVRKVYMILATQLSITTLFIVAVQTSKGFNLFMRENMGLAIAMAVMALCISCAIVCCFGRQVPINYILLFLFTFCESWAIAGITAFYDPTIVMMAGGATALTTVALTIYAWRTKHSIEFFGAIAFVVCLAMLPIAIISIFVRVGALNTVYCCLGVVLYGIFLIIDTMLIVKGDTMSGQKCSMDDYIIGAMMLYLDIINMFLYLLRLFGDRN